MNTRRWSLLVFLGTGLLGCSGSSSTDAGVAVDAGARVDGSARVDAGSMSDAGPTDAGPADAGAPATDPGVGTGSATTMVEQSVDIGATVPLTIYLPSDPSPAPVIVFHHGFQLGPSDYASYGEHLASWGYVVVMPEMPGGLIGGPNHRELRAYMVALLDWIELGEGPLEGRVLVSQIGLAGHSLGGKISLLTAAGDARARAVFGVDPVDAGGGPLGGSAEDFPSVTPELMGDIAAPIVLLGETTNASGGAFGMACAPEADNFQQYYLHATSPALEIEVLGANHMSFLDNPDCGFTCSACTAGSDEPAMTRALTRRYMTAFFNVVLRGETAYSTYLTGDAMATDVTDGWVLSQAKNAF